MLLLNSSHSFEALAWLFISILDIFKNLNIHRIILKNTQIDDVMNYAI